MLAPIELMKSTIDGMIARRFGRIVNVTSHAVKAPIAASPARQSGIWPGSPRNAQMGRILRVFAHLIPSPHCQFAEPGPRNAESLRPFPRKLPFWGE